MGRGRFPPPSQRPAQALPANSLLEQLQPTMGRTFRLAGAALRFETDDQRVMHLATTMFERYGPPADDPGDPLVLRVMVHAPAAAAPPFSTPVYRTHGHLLTIVVGPDGNGVADLLAGYAFAIVSPALVDVAWRLQQVIGTLSLAMLGPAGGHVPLHCACVARGGRSVLVRGHSGAGKSTFAYACIRRGYQVVSDDVVHIAGGAEPRAWGIPWRFQLLPDATRFFPELAGSEARLQPNGERKIDVDVAHRFPGRAVPSAPLGPLLVLSRRPGPTEIERVPDEEASSEIEPVWPWQVGWSATHQTLLDAVARNGVYRLTTGAEPDAMVDALDAFLANEAP
jgi:hypothetical protein